MMCAYFMHKVLNIIQITQTIFTLNRQKKNANKLHSNGGFDVAEGKPFEASDIVRFCSKVVPKLVKGKSRHNSTQNWLSTWQVALAITFLQFLWLTGWQELNH